MSYDNQHGEEFSPEEGDIFSSIVYDSAKVPKFNCYENSPGKTLVVQTQH
jgi:hypothetical protein